MLEGGSVYSRTVYAKYFRAVYTFIAKYLRDEGEGRGD